MELGHRKIAFLSAPLEKISYSRKRRLSGIQDALKSDAKLYVYDSKNEAELDDKSYELELGHDLTTRILQEEPGITALIAANDMIAFGVYKVLREKNIRIPEDVSVCGFDNLQLSELMLPSLTTVDHLTHWRCGLAIDILDNKISNRLSTPLRVNYEPQLIVRNSTGRARI